MNDHEILKREAAARAAIKQAFGTTAGEFTVDLFVAHHLDEMDDDYWQRHLGTRHPEPIGLLDILELRSNREDDENKQLDVCDFTLPEDVTDYVISVRFDEIGNIEDISMES